MIRLNVLHVIAVVFLMLPADINQSYIDHWYHPVYPCTIMEGPGIKYVLIEPNGKIIAEKEDQNERSTDNHHR